MHRFLHHLRNNLGLITLIAGLLIFNYVFDIYIVLSGSMEPVLKTGSAAVINCMDTLPGPGEIAAYKNGSAVVIHRVTAYSSEGYTFKGDSNLDEDPYTVDPSDIIGTMVLSINLPVHVD